MPVVYELTVEDVIKATNFRFGIRRPLSEDPVENGGSSAVDRTLQRHVDGVSESAVTYSMLTSGKTAPDTEMAVDSNEAVVDSGMAVDSNEAVVDTDFSNLKAMSQLSNMTRPTLEPGEHGQSDPTKLLIRDHLPISLWYYEDCDGTCPICMESLMILCSNCESGKKDTCTVSVGRCRHAIHTHCLGLFAAQDLCLICRRPWVTEKKLVLS